MWGGGLAFGTADEPSALEVDHIDEALLQGWSVLVAGRRTASCVKV